MCGIVGLFLKGERYRPSLGDLLTDMLVTMTERGPDSAGVALYADETDGVKITLRAAEGESGFAGLAQALERAVGAKIALRVVDTHAVLTAPGDAEAQVRAVLDSEFSHLRPTASGEAIEIYKEIGLPKDVAARFGLRGMAGTHGVGHTRMATESAVTTDGAHPFSTGPDQCLVHNGSLSNHNSLRRMLAREGFAVSSENDSEVAAAYLTWRMAQGANLGEAMTEGLRDLDGFYTFVVGTKTGFGVVRDPIACKPAVMAETEDYVAFGSEYRALAGLPGVDAAKVWEPEPATVYFWER